MKSQFLKKSFKLLLSISILFFSYYSSYFSYFFHSQVSTMFRFYLQYHGIFDRSYMFLVCNLVILGLVSSSSFKNSSTSTAGEVSNIDVVYPMNYVAEKEPELYSAAGDLENVSVIEEEDDEVGNESIMVERTKEEQNGFSIMDDDEDDEVQEDDGEVGNEFMIDDRANEEQNGLSIIDEKEDLNEKFDDFADKVEEGNILSTEELNKKFDDFIRRMKEEIRFGAQQHLIMVQ